MSQSRTEPAWWSDPRQVAICMAFDAFRICLGAKPTNFSVGQVAQWFGTMSNTTRAARSV